MPQILRGRHPRGIPGRKRHLFLRGMGYHPPAGQENAPNPAQKVLCSGYRQKKASFPARNGIPTACRAGKCLSTCAEGAPRQFRAEKGIISGAERDTNRLPSRKLPPFVHFVVVCFNFFYELELCTASYKVVLGVIGLKVNVTVEEVCKETYTAFKCHKLA